MPDLMLRRNDRGQLTCYVAKKDRESVVARVEFDTEEGWGGTLELEGGERYYLDPQPTRPTFPCQLRARRG
ncbi:MAG: putative nitrogen fixation protein NifT [Magnetococcales bacterium]|nr:putative nitrogen fixation protein NifT [Magnetococcales bacterium]